jgi:hypothetical protein
MKPSSCGESIKNELPNSVFQVLKLFQSAAVRTMFYILEASGLVYITEIQEMEYVKTQIGAFE